jgi:serine/threonine-protein kinase HipA
MGPTVLGAPAGNLLSSSVLCPWPRHERFDRNWRNVGRHDPTAARFRVPLDAWIARLPQEDFCQATGKPSEAKYEKGGGPGMAQILRILDRGAAPERDSNLFALSQVMFWFLAATDGHAKNFSIFLRRDGYELTPFYDLLSAWPVIGNKARQLQPQKVKMAMAMRTGNRPHYRWNEFQPRHFKALAESLSDPNLWSTMLDTARSVPEAIASVSKRLPPDLKESVWTSVTGGFAGKAEEFLRAAEDLRD